MRSADLIRLISLAAIWGASFLFMRMVAPVLGALWTAELRFAIAGAAMFAYMIASKQPMRFGAHWKSYLVLGIFSSALPGSLFAFAALTLPSGYSAILNATTPLWGALIAAAVLGDRITPRTILGLFMGIAGVSFLVRLGPIEFSAPVLVATLACLAATCCYGIANVFTKHKADRIDAPMMATGAQLTAALALVPLLPFAPAPGNLSPGLTLAVLALGLLCSGVAYFLYFRLVVNVGPARSMSVTFLIPLFALFWGWLFLDEAIGTGTLIGCGLVVLATWLVVFQPPKKN
jgi:drug/metabolite transporter (DMT)-like permease